MADAHPAKQQRSKWIMLAALLPVVALIGLLVFRPRTDDPVFKGKHLSFYVAQLPATYTSGDGGYISMPVDAPDMGGRSRAQIAAYNARCQARAEEARKAVRILGERCLPQLLDSVGGKESASDRAVEKGKSLLRWLHIRASPNRTYTARWQAVTALRELKHAGCNLDPAVPRLVQLSRDADADISLAARFLLRHMHREIPIYDYGRQTARP